ncbi:MAG: hypothetical protein ISS79_11875 [Phycisphaerae bacterium]|nr:hypothetical protein [Phycisphaerae bacterium]
MRTNINIQRREGNVNSEHSSDLACESISRGHLIDRMLYFVETVVAYTFGIYAGLVAGSVAGRYIAGVHAEDLRHSIDFLDLSQLQQWQDMPLTFAITGAAAGVLLGLLAIRIAAGIFLNRTIVSFCKKEVTEPIAIAETLGRGVRQIQRRMNRLARKGMIAYQVTASLEKTSTYVAKKNSLLCNPAA